MSSSDEDSSSYGLYGSDSSLSDGETLGTTDHFSSSPSTLDVSTSYRSDRIQNKVKDSHRSRKSLSLNRLKHLIKYNNFIDDSSSEDDDSSLSSSDRKYQQKLKQISRTPSSSLSTSLKNQYRLNPQVNKSKRIVVPTPADASGEKHEEKKKSNSTVPVKLKSSKRIGISHDKKKPSKIATSRSTCAHSKLPTKSSIKAPKNTGSCDDKNLERSIRNLEKELSNLKTKTDRLEDQSIKELRHRSDPRHSISTIISRGRGSVSSSSSKSRPSIALHDILEGSDFDLKKLKKLQEDVDRIKTNMEEIENLRMRFAVVEERVSKLDKKLGNEIASRDDYYIKSNKILKNMELDLANSLEKQSTELSQLRDDIKELKFKQEHANSKSERSCLDQKQLGRLHKALESKLEYHIGRMDDFSRRLDELHSQSSHLTDMNSKIRKQMKLFIGKPRSSSRCDDFTRTKSALERGDDAKRKLNLAKKQEKKDRKDKDQERLDARNPKNDEDVGDNITKKKIYRSHSLKSPSEEEKLTSNKYRTPEELFKQYHSLKKAYQRVFGSK